MTEPKDEKNKQMNQNIQPDKLDITDTESVVASGDSDNGSDTESKVVKFIKSLFPTIVIAIGSFFLVFLLHYFGAFNGLELQLYDLRMKLRGPISGIDSKSALPNAEGFVDLTEPFIDSNKNGTWDDGEMFNDMNGNGKYDNSWSIMTHSIIFFAMLQNH